MLWHGTTKIVCTGYGHFVAAILKSRNRGHEQDADQVNEVENQNHVPTLVATMEAGE